MHTPGPVQDGRKRIRKKPFKQGPPVPAPFMDIRCALGRFVVAVLFYEWDKHCALNGGEHVKFDRDFLAAHATGKNAARWIDLHFPDFSAKGNAILQAHTNYRGLDEQTIEFKGYRRIWGWYHERDKDDAGERFGGRSERHPQEHAALRETLRIVQEIAHQHGPLFQFNSFDLLRPKNAPLI